MHQPNTWGPLVLALVLWSPLASAAQPDLGGEGDGLPSIPLHATVTVHAEPADHQALARVLPTPVSNVVAVGDQPEATSGFDGACCDSSGEFIGGAGLYLLQPFFSNNPAISFFIQGTGPGRREDIRSNFSAVPLLWLGYLSESGLGVRGRWWYLRQGTDQSYTLTPPPTGTLTVLSAAPLAAFIIQDNPQVFAVTSKLQLQVADLEILQSADLGSWSLLFSGGLAYANITQNYNAYAVLAGGIPATPLVSGSSFAGLGPVVALEARHMLFDSWLNLYGSARSRLLFGNARQTAEGGDELKGTQESHQRGVVAIEEVELGIEVNRAISQRRLFGQIALVGQEWFGAGNATRSTRSGPPATLPNFSSEDNSNFGLLGVALRVGVDF